MKRIKFFLAAATFCAATIVGYSVYNNATMTEEQRLIKANIEALSDYEIYVDGLLICYCDTYYDYEDCHRELGVTFYGRKYFFN